MEQNKEKVVETTERPFSEHLAMEMIQNERAKHKAKDIAVVCLAVAVVVITISLSIINYINDVDWRSLFSSYDYVSQDGNGQNYYNSEIRGDVNNGSEGAQAVK